MSAEIYKKVKLAIEQPSDRPTYKSNKLEKKYACTFSKNVENN